jgi:hypothetical protein
MLQDLLTYHKDTILLLAGISFVASVVSLIVLPLIIIRLPKDYFIRAQPPMIQRSPGSLALKLLKDLLGIFLILAGFVMLFIPGQGILTMLFGITLMDFPGKHRLQGKLMAVPRVHRSLNWLRAFAKRPPFSMDSTCGGKSTSS